RDVGLPGHPGDPLGQRRRPFVVRRDAAHLVGLHAVSRSNPSASPTLRTLPVGVVGSSSTTATYAGRMCRGSTSLSRAHSSAGSVVTPGGGTTNSRISWPVIGEGTPTAAQSSTPGSLATTLSSADEEMFSP